MLSAHAAKTARCASNMKHKSLYIVANNHQSKSNVCKSLFSTIPQWATCDPLSLGETESVYNVRNIVDGKWSDASDGNLSHAKRMIIPNPLNKDKYPIFTIPDTQSTELQPFIDSMNKIKKSGVHNPLKVNILYYICV